MSAIRFDDETHRYSLDGHPATAVSTILEGGIPKGRGLLKWAAITVATAAAKHASTVDAVREMGRQPFIDALVATVDEAKHRAQIKGTDIHALGELVVGGEPVSLVAHADEVEGYARWLDDSGFAPEQVETMVGSRRYNYCGRFDMLGVIRGERWLLDIKTGRAVYPETPCQLAAYACAEFMVLDDGRDIELPDVDHIGVVHVTPLGTSLLDMGPLGAAFTEFLAARTIHLSARRRRALCEAEPVRFEVSA